MTGISGSGGGQSLRNTMVRILAAGTALSGLSAPAMAQVQADGASAAGDIIVTARKREESVQDVPISIGVIGGEQLQALGAEGFSTFANRTAGLQLIQTDPTQTQLVVRGIVASFVTSDVGQIRDIVGLYIDDVPVNVASATPNFQLVDLQRVEVLRGPQGTLFGDGAMGGAIRYVTNKPDASGIDLAAGGTLSTTDNGGTNYTVDGMVNLPIITDKLAVRAVVSYRDMDGWIDNLGTGVDNSNTEENLYLRGAVKFDPTDRLSFTAQAIYQQIDLGDRFVFFDEYRRPAAITTLSPSVYAQRIAEFGPYGRDTNFAETRRDRNQLYTFDASYSGDRFAVKSITGYRDTSNRVTTEFGRSPFVIQFFLPTFRNLGLLRPGTVLPLAQIQRNELAFAGPTGSDVRSFTQELRVESSLDGPFNFVVGGFYMDERRDTFQRLGAPGVEDRFQLVPGPSLGVATDTTQDTNLNLKTEQVSVFGEVNFKPTDRLELTAGGRYFDFRQRSLFESRGIGTFLPASANLLSVTNRVTDNGFNPAFSVQYRATDEVQAYGRIAKGFRLGGVSTPPSLLFCAADIAALGLQNTPGVFKADTLWNYEAGLKTRSTNGRVTSNIAAFYIDWSDIQSFGRLPNCGLQVFDNAGKARSYGVEWETTLRPTEGLQFDLALTYTKANLTSVGNSPILGQLLRAGADDPLPYTPEIQIYAAISYETEFGGGWRGFAGADVSLVGERYNGFASAPLTQRMPSYTLSNARLGVRRDQLSATLFVENLTNEIPEFNREFYTFHEAYLDFGAGAGRGVNRISTARPRTIGVTLRYDYR